MRLNFCKISEKEIEKVILLWKEVFNYSQEKSRILYDVSLAGIKSQVSEIFGIKNQKGELIGALKNDYYWMKVGEGKIFISDIGYVSIKPEFQGKGYGTYLMEEDIKYLRSKSVHIARLGGLVKFYERFGFSIIPSFWFAFPLDDVIAGNKKIPIIEVLKVKEREIKIREFNKKDDLEVYEKLSYNDWKVRKIIDENQKKFIRERKYEPELKRYVVEYKNTPFGFLFSYNNVIYDYVFKDEERFFVNLLKWFLCEKYNEKFNEVKILHLFSDNILEKKLIDEKIPFEKVEKNSSIASSMVCIISFNSLIKHLMPEFQKKKRKMLIKITLSDRKISEEIKIMNSPNKNCTKMNLEITQSEFIKFLFGISSTLYTDYKKRVLEKLFVGRCGFFL